MPEYRRAYVEGGTFFFTIVTHQRRPLFSDAANVERLRMAIRLVKQERPFEITAGVVLPDHSHFIWTLPEGDSDYSDKTKVARTTNSNGAGLHILSFTIN